MATCVLPSSSAALQTPDLAMPSLVLRDSPPLCGPATSRNACTDPSSGGDGAPVSHQTWREILVKSRRHLPLSPEQERRNSPAPSGSREKKLPGGYGEGRDPLLDLRVRGFDWDGLNRGKARSTRAPATFEPRTWSRTASNRQGETARRRRGKDREWTGEVVRWIGRTVERRSETPQSRKSRRETGTTSTGKDGPKGAAPVRLHVHPRAGAPTSRMHPV
eukprot:scaffold776_cov347-Pavlova_lutheri.AAC.15